MRLFGETCFVLRLLDRITWTMVLQCSSLWHGACIITPVFPVETQHGCALGVHAWYWATLLGRVCLHSFAGFMATHCQPMQLYTGTHTLKVTACGLDVKSPHGKWRFDSPNRATTRCGSHTQACSVTFWNVVHAACFAVTSASAAKNSKYR